MTYFLSGGAKSGKSSLSQDLAVALRGKRYYVATLIPDGAEDQERIRRHLADRDGLGFETVECFTNILHCLDVADPEGVFLVDSVTSLMQNALFPAEKNYAMDVAAAKECTDALIEFSRRVRHAVFVSDNIYSEAQHYDDGTEQYRRCLAEADRRLAAACDTVVEVVAGQTLIYKGELP